MAWTCEQTEERLSDYLDNLLSVSERGELAAHSESCARCAPLLARVSATVRAMHQLEEMEVPADLVGRILERTISPRQPKKAWFGWLRPVLQPRFALGFATVLATFGIVAHSLGPRMTHTGLANLSPVSLYRSVDRRAHLAYARGAKFVNDLRVVYEIQSRLQTEPATPAPAEPSGAPNQGTPEKKNPGQVNRAIPKNTVISLAEFLPLAILERNTR